jgi:hypothetical protein
MRWATASAISDTGCGSGKVQSSAPPGRGAGANASCTVFASAATGAIANTAGTPDEPSITSTLSSATKRRAFFTAPVVSEASSSTISRTADALGPQRQRGLDRQTERRQRAGQRQAHADRDVGLSRAGERDQRAGE